MLYIWQLIKLQVSARGECQIKSKEERQDPSLPPYLPTESSSKGVWITGTQVGGGGDREGSASFN